MCLVGIRGYYFLRFETRVEYIGKWVEVIGKIKFKNERSKFFRCVFVVFGCVREVGVWEFGSW